MTTHALSQDLLVIIAERFKALGEPVRLRLLNELRDGERSVTELVEATKLGQANVSRHLHILYTSGLLVRRREGASCATRSLTIACTRYATSCATGWGPNRRRCGRYSERSRLEVES